MLKELNMLELLASSPSAGWHELGDRDLGLLLLLALRARRFERGTFLAILAPCDVELEATSCSFPVVVAWGVADLLQGFDRLWLVSGPALT